MSLREEYELNVGMDGRRVESTLQRMKRLGEEGRVRGGKEDPRSNYQESF
jgi:hypothetical protein